MGLLQGHSFALHIARTNRSRHPLGTHRTPKSCTTMVRNARAALRVDHPKFQDPTRAGTFCTLSLHLHITLFPPDRLSRSDILGEDHKREAVHALTFTQASLQGCLSLFLEASHSHKIIFSWVTRKCFSSGTACQTPYLYLHSHHLLQLFSTLQQLQLQVVLQQLHPPDTSNQGSSAVRATGLPRELQPCMWICPSSMNHLEAFLEPEAKRGTTQVQAHSDGSAALSLPWISGRWFWLLSLLSYRSR